MSSADFFFVVGLAVFVIFWVCLIVHGWISSVRFKVEEVLLKQKHDRDEMERSFKYAGEATQRQFDLLGGRLSRAIESLGSSVSSSTRLLSQADSAAEARFKEALNRAEKAQKDLGVAVHYSDHYKGAAEKAERESETLRVMLREAEAKCEALRAKQGKEGLL